MKSATLKYRNADFYPNQNMYYIYKVTYDTIVPFKTISTRLQNFNITVVAASEIFMSG